MDMKTITPLHLLVQGDSGNLRTWLYDLFIKGFSTHYFLATRLFLPAASTRSASIPAAFSNRAYPHCAGPTPVIYPSTAVPKPGATRAPHVLHFYLFPLVRHTWRAASRQTTGCWHGHLALLTSPVSSFDFCLLHLLCPPQSFLPDCSPWVNFTFQLPVKRTSDFAFLPGMRKNHQASDGKFTDVGFGFRAAVWPLIFPLVERELQSLAGICSFGPAICVQGLTKDVIPDSKCPSVHCWFTEIF